MTRRAEAWLWIAQRASAAVMAVFVAVHLATMIYAVRGGLSAGEILGRTQGRLGWLLFYGLFVLAAAVHTPIGLRVVAREWLGWRGRSADLAAALAGGGLLAGGLRAVWSMYA